MKRLLIEDDVRVAQILAEAFGEDGHETTIRYTGEDGLAYLTRERPDAVVPSCDRSDRPIRASRSSS